MNLQQVRSLGTINVFVIQSVPALETSRYYGYGQDFTKVELANLTARLLVSSY